MSYVFPSDTFEGTIERKYEPLIRQRLLDPEEVFRFLAEKTKGQTVAPPNFGDLLIESADVDPDAKQFLEKLRRHGVRDEDIRSWYNMHIMERECILHLLDVMKQGMWWDLLKNDMDPVDAKIAVHKKLPRYGDPDNPNWGAADKLRLTEEDRPLPVELYNVMSDFVEQHNNDPTFHAELSRATSLNAVIRQKIRSGELFRARKRPLDTLQSS